MPTFLLAENDQHASAVLETANGTVCLPSRDCWACMWNVFWYSHPRQVSLQRQSKASYFGWNFSREASFVCTQQMNRPECGFLLVHSSKLTLGCFSLKRPSTSRPHTSTSIRNVRLLKEYKMQLSVLWKPVLVRWTEGGCIGISVWHGLHLVRKPAIWSLLKISTPRLS